MRQRRRPTAALRPSGRRAGSLWRLPNRRLRIYVRPRMRLNEPWSERREEKEKRADSRRKRPRDLDNHKLIGLQWTYPDGLGRTAPSHYSAGDALNQQEC